MRRGKHLGCDEVLEMIYINRNGTRKEQLFQQTKRCYDDYCFYNHFDNQKRREFVESCMSNIGESELVIPYLPVYLTTVCSLNCKKCNKHS